MRQSLLRQEVVEVCPEGVSDLSGVIELVDEVRVPPPRLELERAEITLSVLRPTGVFPLLRSRDVTVS